MNILIFGPNGSGKGTQGSIITEKLGIPHIETGVIFRDNISNGTDLGRKAKNFIDNGELVPDEITIPMVLQRLLEDDCTDGWLLDGFPRNLSQARELDKALRNKVITTDVVIEIVLERQIAKNRIMGRRLCVADNNHPNNVNIDAIKPDNGKCRVCNGNLATRPDDQDEEAIDKRLNIYFDTKTGTMAAINFSKKLSQENSGVPEIIEVDGRPSVKEISNKLILKLD